MGLSFAAVLIGLLLLIYSADRFVAGAAAAARHLGMPSILIGMVVIGFGTSAPEMVVSAISASQGNPGIALGNAYGSNIANIALILGVTALLSPITVHSQVLRKELPLLLAVTALAGGQLLDGDISRLDAVGLLVVFAGLMGWSIATGMRRRTDPLAQETLEALSEVEMTMGRALWWIVLGCIVLVISSRMLVWGAVDIARAFGVSDLVIGLTIVAIGTSLPELASAVAATRKREHDLVLGNVLGSNLFNTLAVVGIAGAIHPMSAAPEVLTRDFTAMALITALLLVFCYGRLKPGRISRVEGVILLCAYAGYNLYLVGTTFPV